MPHEFSTLYLHFCITPTGLEGQIEVDVDVEDTTIQETAQNACHSGGGRGNTCTVCATVKHAYELFRESLLMLRCAGVPG